MKTKRIVILILTLANLCFSLNGQISEKNFTIFSPDSTIEMNIHIRNEIFYTVKKHGTTILYPSPISMTVDGKIFGHNAVVNNKATKSIQKTIEPVWGLKKAIESIYNELTLNFTEGFSLVFRAYDEGIAYQWETASKKEIIITTEEVIYNFENDPYIWLPTKPTFETAWEKKGIWEMEKNKDYVQPIVLQTTPNLKAVITEADVLDYPSMYLKKNSPVKSILAGSFQKYPLKTEWGGFNNYTQSVIEKAEYIAKTSGTRTFPWRVLILSDDDKTLLYNELIYKLASDQKIHNTNWIEPGKVAWEWWNDYLLKNVDFQTGINTKTYLYHIDFAAKYNIKYILIDWKWTDDRDLTMVNPDVDIVKICDYAKGKGVKVLVWTPSYTLDMHLDEVLDLFKSYGVSGIKVDFFDRDDQLANQMYERIAAGAAKREFVVDFHGCAIPSGLSKVYPNVLNYEAVRGNENNKWGTGISPSHHIDVAFIRMLCGTMDFTPGGMRNVGKGKWHANSTPFVQGTRAHQSAMFVVYFEALKMMADSPTEYEAEPEYTKFISEIPTVWDDVVVLEAKFGEFISIARKTGDTWYIGIMSDWTEREIQVDFSFLNTGNYTATLLKDGVNAKKYAVDYKIEEISISEETILNLHIAPGGGAVIKVTGK